jgi:hypothetical protein
MPRVFSFELPVIVIPDETSDKALIVKLLRQLAALICPNPRSSLVESGYC